MRLLYAIMAVLALVSSGASAEVGSPKFTGNPVRDVRNALERETGIKTTGDLGYDLAQALDAKLLPDLKYALLLAKATKNDITASCWEAWIAVITTQQTAVNDDQGNPLPVPDPHVITSFERLVELRNMLQPTSDFMVKCSPVASMVKKDIASFMGVVISGGAGIAAMVPGL